MPSEFEGCTRLLTDIELRTGDDRGPSGEGGVFKTTVLGLCCLASGCELGMDFAEEDSEWRIIDSCAGEALKSYMRAASSCLELSSEYDVTPSVLSCEGCNRNKALESIRYEQVLCSFICQMCVRSCFILDNSLVSVLFLREIRCACNVASFRCRSNLSMRSPSSLLKQSIFALLAAADALFAAPRSFCFTSFEPLSMGFQLFLSVSNFLFLTC